MPQLVAVPLKLADPPVGMLALVGEMVVPSFALLQVPGSTERPACKPRLVLLLGGLPVIPWATSAALALFGDGM